MAIGMIFQIVDDIIDIFSAHEQSGKTRTDLREACVTLPCSTLREEGRSVTSSVGCSPAPHRGRGRGNVP